MVLASKAKRHTEESYLGAGHGGRDISERLRIEADKKKTPKPSHGKR